MPFYSESEPELNRNLRILMPLLSTTGRASGCLVQSGSAAAVCCLARIAQGIIVSLPDFLEKSGVNILSLLKTPWQAE